MDVLRFVINRNIPNYSKSDREDEKARYAALRIKSINLARSICVYCYMDMKLGIPSSDDMYKEVDFGNVADLVYVQLSEHKDVYYEYIEERIKSGKSIDHIDIVMSVKDRIKRNRNTTSTM